MQLSRKHLQYVVCKMFNNNMSQFFVNWLDGVHVDGTDLSSNNIFWVGRAGRGGAGRGQEQTRKSQPRERIDLIHANCNTLKMVNTHPECMH